MDQQSLTALHNAMVALAGLTLGIVLVLLSAA